MSVQTTAESSVLEGLDRQLVRCLQLDPRAPFSRIGAALEVSEQTVARRYRRLRRERLVRVVGVVDPKALGLADWMVRVRCRPDGVAALAAALAQREDVAWVTITSGGWEVTFALRARTEADRDDLLVRLPRSAPVLDVAASVILHRYLGNDPADWTGLRAALTPRQARMLTRAPRNRPTGEEQLQPGDELLLRLLARDGRTSYTALARASTQSTGRVMRRVAALEAAGVVYFDLDIAVAAIGRRTSAALWLSAQPRNLDAAGKALAGHDEVQFAAATSGRWNLFASLTCDDLDALHRYVTSKLAVIEGIAGFELAPVLRRVKQAGALVDRDRLADPLPASAMSPRATATSNR